MNSALGLLMVAQAVFGTVKAASVAPSPENTVIASQVFSLENRHANENVNQVFVDNILLTLKMMETGKPLSKPIDWEEIQKEFTVSFTLKPQEVFAFHDALLPAYKDKKVITTNAYFNAQQGFKFSGFLYGDGVCHLASFMNIVAKKAGLSVEAPSRHTIAKIPDVADEDGVSILTNPLEKNAYANKNLYIANTTEKDITFTFWYSGKTLSIFVTESK